MKRSSGLFFALLLAVVLGATGLAFAQWRWPNQNQNQNAPRDGACFYLDGGYSNQSFCLSAGQSADRMPPGFNDQITAIRVFGRARVVVFENSNFSGPSETFDRSQNDLRNIRKRDDPSRVWSDRISSVRVEYAEGRADDRWGRNGRDDDDRWRDRDDDRYGDRDDRGWHGRNNPNYPVWGRGSQPRQGVCFFRDSNFRGDYFCMARGESLRSMPPGFNDRISSVRLFGGSRVLVYQDSDFRGRQARFGRDIADLHDRRVRDDQDRNWNDRISSIQVQ